jgi:hypothetical protein
MPTRLRLRRGAVGRPNLLSPRSLRLPVECERCGRRGGYASEPADVAVAECCGWSMSRPMDGATVHVAAGDYSPVDGAATDDGPWMA